MPAQTTKIFTLTSGGGTNLVSITDKVSRYIITGNGVLTGNWNFNDNSPSAAKGIYYTYDYRGNWTTGNGSQILFHGVALTALQMTKRCIIEAIQSGAGWEVKVFVDLSQDRGIERSKIYEIPDELIAGSSETLFIPIFIGDTGATDKYELNVQIGQLYQIGSARCYYSQIDSDAPTIDTSVKISNFVNTHEGIADFVAGSGIIEDDFNFNTWIVGSDYGNTIHIEIYDTISPTSIGNKGFYTLLIRLTRHYTN